MPPPTDDTASPAVPSGKRSRHGLAAFHLASLLGSWLALRLVLFLAFQPDAPATVGEMLLALVIGLQRDLYVGLILTLPFLLWSLVLPNRWFAARWHRVLLMTGFAVFWLVQVFLLFAEFYFFEEFRSRFNTVAVDYLLYPDEVFINIWDSYPVPAVLAGCGGLAAAWVVGAVKLCKGLWAPVPFRARLVPCAVALGVVALLTPTVPLKGTRFSRERVVNELANNGALSFVSAFWTRHLDYAAFYKTLPRDEGYRRVRRLITEAGSEFVGEGDNLRRRVAGDPARPRLNLVLILEESLGSEFWGCLGRKEPTCTPEMDRLATEEGLLFTQIYASGNRTVRGFEGVLSSFPPLPGDSIVRRDQSQNVETLARVLKRDGYHTLFVYGGRGVFDGMRAYSLNNGYDRFLEQKHFTQPTFTTIWGVCDEDILARTIEECRELAQSGQPFFTTVLSVSNHKPYTYPKGRIAEDPEARKRRHAVKYSDYALGQFFRAAKQETFWTNTIFVVLADHGARVYGSQSIPIHSYEIPLVILGPAVVKSPSRVPHLGCSLDVAPTVLGLLGRPYETLFLGRDLLKAPPAGGRVLLNHNRDIGLFARDRLVVLNLRKTSEFYQGDPQQVGLTRLATPGPLELELENDTIALYQAADDLYMNRRFRIDP